MKILHERGSKTVVITTSELGDHKTLIALGSTVNGMWITGNGPLSDWTSSNAAIFLTCSLYTLKILKTTPYSAANIHKSVRTNKGVPPPPAERQDLVCPSSY